MLLRCRNSGTKGFNFNGGTRSIALCGPVRMAFLRRSTKTSLSCPASFSTTSVLSPLTPSSHLSGIPFTEAFTRPNSLSSSQSMEDAATSARLSSWGRKVVKDIDDQTARAVSEIIELLEETGGKRTIQEYRDLLGKPIFLPLGNSSVLEQTTTTQAAASQAVAETETETEVYYIDEDLSLWTDFLSEIRKLQQSRHKDFSIRRWKVRRGVHQTIRLFQAMKPTQWRKIEKQLDGENHEASSSALIAEPYHESQDIRKDIIRDEIEDEGDDDIHHVLDELSSEVIRRALSVASESSVGVSTEFYNVLLARTFVALDLSATECQELVHEIRDHMNQTTMTPHDAVSYEILIRGVSQRLGSPNSATEFLRDLTEDSSFRSQSTMRAAMQLCKDLKKEGVAIDLWQCYIEHDKNNYRLPLDVIDAYVHVLKLHDCQTKAVDALRLALEQNTEPSNRMLDSICMHICDWPTRSRASNDNAYILESTMGILSNENTYKSPSNVWEKLIIAAAKNPESDDRRTFVVHSAFKTLIKTWNNFVPDGRLAKIGLDVCQELNDPWLAIDIFSRRLASVFSKIKGRDNSCLGSWGIPIGFASDTVDYSNEQPCQLLRVSTDEAIHVMSICIHAADTEAIQSVMALVRQYEVAFHSSLLQELTSSAVCAFVSRGDTQMAIDCLQKLVSQGESPREKDFGVIMHGYVIEGKYQAAEELFESLESGEFDGVVPGPTCFNSLVLGCLYAKKWEEALLWYDTMLESGVKPLDATYAGLLLSAYRLGGDEQALTLLTQMVSLEASVSGTTAKIALRVLIPEIGQEESLEDIRKRIRGLIDEGQFPTEPMLALMSSIRVAELEDEKLESSSPYFRSVDGARWLTVLSNLRNFVETEA